MWRAFQNGLLRLPRCLQSLSSGHHELLECVVSMCVGSLVCYQLEEQVILVSVLVSEFSVQLASVDHMRMGLRNFFVAAFLSVSVSASSAGVVACFYLW